MLLSEIFPERKDAILDVGKEIGANRYLGGMHYPTDVEAGQKLGEAVAKRLLANPEFRKPFEEVKADLATELKKQRVSEKMQSTADQVHDALAKTPGSAADIAKKFGVEIATVTDATPGSSSAGMSLTPCSFLYQS